MLSGYLPKMVADTPLSLDEGGVDVICTEFIAESLDAFGDSPFRIIVGVIPDDVGDLVESGGIRSIADE